jgi:hypothetical protein
MERFHFGHLHRMEKIQKAQLLMEQTSIPKAFALKGKCPLALHE